MQRLAWCVVLCASPLSAMGAELFRCVTSAGAVAYQDVPCGQGSRLTKTIVVPEAAGDRPARTSKAKAGKAMKRAGAKATRTASPRDTRSRQRESCAIARAEQQRVLDAVGLDRTFDQLRTLGDAVHAACKGL